MPPTTQASAVPSARERSTIEQVAHAAGVSVATVSRALRGLPNVATSTRTRVEEVARELNYRANPAAARLAAGRSHTIAIVVPLINSWYFSNVVGGAEAVFAEEGYDVLVLTAPDAEQRREVVMAAAERLHRHVDGMIFAEVALPPAELNELGMGVFGVATIGQETDAFPSVRVDNEMVGRLAGEHLASLGHHRIGVLGAQAEAPAYFDVPGQRIDGLKRALAAAGIELDRRHVVDGRFTIQGGFDGAHELFRRDDPPSAVFALSDEMAFGVLAAARELGVNIPDDVSLMGVDDHELSSVIGLTTVRQRVSEHGALAARALLRFLSGSDDERSARTLPVMHHVDDVELVVRSTTAPPR